MTADVFEAVAPWQGEAIETDVVVKLRPHVANWHRPIAELGELTDSDLGTWYTDLRPHGLEDTPQPTDWFERYVIRRGSWRSKGPYPWSAGLGGHGDDSQFIGKAGGRYVYEGSAVRRDIGGAFARGAMFVRWDRERPWVSQTVAKHSACVTGSPLFVYRHSPVALVALPENCHQGGYVTNGMTRIENKWRGPITHDGLHVPKPCPGGGRWRVTLPGIGTFDCLDIMSGASTRSPQGWAGIELPEHMPVSSAQVRAIDALGPVEFRYVIPVAA